MSDKNGAAKEEGQRCLDTELEGWRHLDAKLEDRLRKYSNMKFLQSIKIDQNIRG